jgi:hypothetical protein
MRGARLAFATGTRARRRRTPHKAALHIRPVRQQPQDLVEVLERIQPVQPARGDHAEERGGGLGVGVTAVKHPRFSTDDDLAERALGARVVQRQVDVVEHAHQLVTTGLRGDHFHRDHRGPGGPGRPGWSDGKE